MKIIKTTTRILSLILLLVTVSCSLLACNPSNEETVNIILNETYRLCKVDGYSTVEVTPTFLKGEESLTDYEVSYSIEDESIASVSQDGKITAAKDGETQLTVKVLHKRKTYEKKATVKVLASISASDLNTFNESYLKRFGRVEVSGGRTKKMNVDHVASGFEVGFFGTELKVTASTSRTIYFRYFVDGDKEGVFKKSYPASAEYIVAENLPNGYHTVRLLKSSELDEGLLTIENIATDGVFVPTESADLKIEYIGDSITAGYGVLGERGSEARSTKNSDGTKTLAYLSAQKLNADHSIIALAGIAINVHLWRDNVVMKDLYKQKSLNDTSAYDFSKWQPDIVVCLMGENSYGYCINKDSSYYNRFSADYLAFLQYIQSVRPNAKIVCVYGMMNNDYLIRSAITEAALQAGDGVTTLFVPKGNFEGAGYHPGRKAQEEFATLIAEHIKSIL